MQSLSRELLRNIADVLAECFVKNVISIWSIQISFLRLKNNYFFLIVCYKLIANLCCLCILFLYIHYKRVD